MTTDIRHALFALYLALLVVSCSTSLQDKIVGEWRGTDSDGEMAYFAFDTDGNVRMIRGNLVVDAQTLGGKVTWRLDTGHDPMHLDLVVTPPSGTSRTLPMIVRFITDSKIQLRMPDNMTSRPKEFWASDNRDQIVLRKE